MKEKDVFLKNSASVIEEVEEQLTKILGERRRKIEEELEEVINRQKQEAQNKINELEKEVTEERESLSEYKTLLSNFEQEKASIKDEIKSHLNIVMKLQSEIESITKKSLEELKIIDDLNKKLENINEETLVKLSSLRKKLEDKYGIEAEIPEAVELVDEDFDLDEELEKLNKIKELLGENGSQTSVSEIEEQLGEELEEAEGSEETEELEEEEEAAEELKKEEEEGYQEEEEETEESELEIEEEGEQEEEEEEEVKTEGEEDTQTKEEEVPQEEQKEEAYQKLEEFKKVEGKEDEAKVVYFENEGKVTLDCKHIIDSITKGIQNAESLYIKLEDTTSPKEHFFIKQEIIQEQENVRKLILNCLRVCEMKDCFFPKSTEDVVNSEKLKEILEKVSMENWSNENDFSSFSEFINDLKKEFDAKSTPFEEYTESILNELSG